MSTFRNGSLWKDRTGAPIHAHGGYIIFTGDIITGTERIAGKTIMSAVTAPKT